jgi:hypothetical protein
MKSDTAGFGRPERFLLLMARGEDGCHGKAVRMSDGEELRFSDLEALKQWLETAAPPGEGSA